jgi:hypothetical protein
MSTRPQTTEEDFPRLVDVCTKITRFCGKNWDKLKIIVSILAAVIAILAPIINSVGESQKHTEQNSIADEHAKSV